jgi:hypothetical protein
MKTVSVRTFEFIIEIFMLTKLQNKLPQSTDIIAKSKHSSANDFFEEQLRVARDRIKARPYGFGLEKSEGPQRLHKRRAPSLPRMIFT